MNVELFVAVVIAFKEGGAVLRYFVDTSGIGEIII